MASSRVLPVVSGVFLLDERRSELIKVTGSEEHVVNGEYMYSKTVRGKRGYSPIFTNATKCIMQRNVDFDNTTWKIWHPAHHKGYAFFYVVSDSTQEPYLPPASGWVADKGSGTLEVNVISGGIPPVPSPSLGATESRDGMLKCVI